MSSSQDVYRRVGRGGAGNWYSKQEIDDADKAKLEDIEAQKQSNATAASDNPNQAAAYSRAGRGGAGNFYDAKDADEARRREREDSKRTVSALAAASSAAATSKAPRAGLSGRGGAGNWSTDQAALAAAAEERERRRRDDLEAQVLQDVDAGLAPPPAAYRHQGREVEEK
ncbi:hypothetical protein GE09DRAFT_1217667 [Coniochaeta sp. 2T2.1]|nr:hypothetical protein GE09DRAFT_1217667 [Coniochaeta sp. 2T2.1]